ncbi:hypothetical protein C4K01_5004 [Pseudomonas synxantha]|nr:hypothetical protein C4K01_5004 [Pseudomonas synxantha]
MLNNFAQRVPEPLKMNELQGSIKVIDLSNAFSILMHDPIPSN